MVTVQIGDCVILKLESINEDQITTQLTYDLQDRIVNIVWRSKTCYLLHQKHELVCLLLVPRSVLTRLKCSQVSS